MAFTTAQLDAIETAIGQGVLTVTYNGMTTTYRNMTDLVKARDMIRADLQASGSLSQPIRTSYSQRVRD